MILKKDELIKKVGEIFGDDNRDEVLELLEDLTDTLNSFDDGWKDKYEENDKMWRERYKTRFYGGSGETDEVIDGEAVEEEVKTKTFEELFKED